MIDLLLYKRIDLQEHGEVIDKYKQAHFSLDEIKYLVSILPGNMKSDDIKLTSHILRFDACKIHMIKKYEDEWYIILYVRPPGFLDSYYLVDSFDGVKQFIYDPKFIINPIKNVV